MKKSAEYARKIKQLLNKIKREKGAVQFTELTDPLEILLLGILSNTASENRAAVVLSRIRSSMPDLNEIRVTSVAELIEIIGTDYPKCRPVADEILAVLNSIFNRRHDLDLGFLKGASRKSTEEFLDSLDGLSSHARAFFIQRFSKAHAVPLDENMHQYLLRHDYVPEGTKIDEAQKFIVGRIRERDGMKFYVKFKKFASAHASRKSSDKEPETAIAMTVQQWVRNAEADAPAVRTVAAPAADPSSPASTRRVQRTKAIKKVAERRTTNKTTNKKRASSKTTPKKASPPRRKSTTRGR